MGEVQEELRVRASTLATAALVRAERHDFDAKSVHATRAGAKRLRALWQLLRGVVDEGTACAANARLRDSNRLLANARDAFVARKTIDKLVKRCNSGKDRKALRAFRETFHDDPQPDIQPGLRGIEAVYREEAASWRRLRLEAPDQAVIYSGIRRTYGKGRKLARRARKLGEPAAYHRWRKWVKYLLYQLEALEPRLIDWQRDQLAALDKLGDALGKYSDLQNLRARLASRNLSPRVRERVADVIDRRARKLRRRSHKLQREVYRARPEIFAASVARAVTAPEPIPLPLMDLAGD